MKEKNNSVGAKALQIIPLIICIGAIVIYLLAGKNVSVEAITEFAPKDPLRAALFVIMLYAVKSLTVFFPIVILYILGGFLFDPITALIVNSLGVLAELTVPYWIGKKFGSRMIQGLLKKFPRIAELAGKKNKNVLFSSFFLRIIAILPADAISIYLGSRGVRFMPYIIGSFLGILPSAACATLMGASITDPTSPTFMICTGITVGIAIVSLIIHLSLKRNTYKK